MAFGVQCVLRGVLGSTRDLPTLTSHPAAAIGSVFHRLLEMAVRGQIDQLSTPAEDADRMLEHLLDEEKARLSSAWTLPVPDLRSVFPPIIWRRKRRAVLDLAESCLSGAVPTVSALAFAGTRTAKDLPAIGCWSELRIEVPELRLAGRADLVEREPGKVTIRDLKTGRVLADDAKILPHIERQMRLYGVMARRVWPDAEVRLVVDDGNEREVSFRKEEENELVNWLNSVLLRLPSDGTVATELLATPGEACEGCAHRHLCPAYRSAAPQFWRTDTVFRLPLDTWGQLASIAPRPNAQCDLTLTDAADRTVKVFGLLESRVSELSTGDRVWLYGLRTRDRRGGPESWRHPRNFFEIADDDPFARAWTLQTFADG